MRQKIIYVSLIIVVLGIVALGYKFFIFDKSVVEREDLQQEVSGNDLFRAKVVDFVRMEAEKKFSGEESEYPESGEGEWSVSIEAFFQGDIISQGESFGKGLDLSLISRAVGAMEGLTRENLDKVRFKIDISGPSGAKFSFIECEEGAAELVSDIVPLRHLDKKLIKEKIDQGKEFLLRSMDGETRGFHKKYHAVEDFFEPRLHSVYSASIIYTFLYIYDYEKDEEVLDSLSGWGDFLLFMQNRNEGSNKYGAFHYSYFTDTKEKEEKYVIGTAALNIFTLLRLYEFTGEERYLESARLAGDWLLTMQDSDGTMAPYVRKRETDGKWVHGTKESLLYEGQTLSSLSKLYNETQEEKYYEAAKKIAERFAGKYREAQGYVKGDYRDENPISNSWVVMSLMDFVKAAGEEEYNLIVFELSNLVLDHQIKDKDDVLNHGRWEGAYSTSGIGWISEVMTDTYRFCLREGRGDCEKYKQAVVRGIRWIIQNTYNEKNSFFLKNPEMALGGVFWNNSQRYVRTDSNCHALNAYTRIIGFLGEGELASVPEDTIMVDAEQIK